MLSTAVNDLVQEYGEEAVFATFLERMARTGKLLLRFGDLSYGDDHIVPVNTVEVYENNCVVVSNANFCCSSLANSIKDGLSI